MAPIITITTDFGDRDGFVAQMKGIILSMNPLVRLVDVTHDIEPFSVTEAALVLKGISRYFPPGTIHVAVVDPGVGGRRRGIVLRTGGAVYVGPDNGIFCLVHREETASEVREIRNAEYFRTNPHPTFHGRDVFAPVAANLSLGKPFDKVGPAVLDPVPLSIPGVRRTESSVEGEVIHLDSFGNLCSNIESAMIGRPVRTVAVGNVNIRGLSRFFSEVDAGQPLALINSYGYLEISVNSGNAGRALGISKGDKVIVHFGDG